MINTLPENGQRSTLTTKQNLEHSSVFEEDKPQFVRS